MFRNIFADGLWICGLIAQGNLLTLDMSKIRVFDNTLQTIACGYVIAALAILIRVRWLRWTMPVLLALAYTAPLAVWGDYAPKGNLAHLVEVRIVNTFFMPLGSSGCLTDYTWFSTIPMFGVMTLMGMISLAILYYVTEVLKFRRGLGLFILLGQFALTAYMLADTPLVAITSKAIFLVSIVRGVFVTLALVVRRRMKAL